MCCAASCRVHLRKQGSFLKPELARYFIDPSQNSPAVIWWLQEVRKRVRWYSAWGAKGTHLTMSVIQEPTTITSNVSSVMIWLRQVCYFQSIHLLTQIFKYLLLICLNRRISVQLVRHFPEETQKLKHNRLFEAKPGNIWKLFSHLSNETYLSSALAGTWRKYGKRVEVEDSLLMGLDRIQSYCGCRMEEVSMDFFNAGPYDCAQPSEVYN